MRVYKHYTPLGLILLAEEEQRFVKIWLADSDEEQAHRRSPLLPQPYASDLDLYFRGETVEFNWPLKLVGTPFQKRVWQELLQIPYGKTTTYKQLSEKIGTKGYRAVGQAVGANPLIIVVPCHRVLAARGLGGYSCGLEMKQSLLRLEKILREERAR